ncbi:hypothetical protein GGH94_001406 [Coemansia aciculifera]|uniref:Ubiquitin-protein ligase E3A N-terminal zinc-binding domain-containing protein n=1 Tax=Coemansia aciculifera TaxID=417176 RepID=A0A9W8ISL4_9FUNG|nr:hypothetical protein GGH94_001406 [Coemansia aciculifera]
MTLTHSEFKQTLRCTKVPHSAATGFTDKLYLPPSTLTALLDSSKRNGLSNGATTTNGRYQSHRAPYYSPFSSEETDYSTPSQTDLLPSPLIFRLIPAAQTGLHDRQRNSRAVHCSVREFSHEEGHAGIPEWLMNEMELAEGDSVSLELVRLQKGTHAQLKALNPMARGVGDLRSLLEAYMRTKLTALTVGETLLVPINGVVEPLSFSVAALEPSDAIDIVDTDLSVDIVYADSGPILDHSAVEHNSASGNELVSGVGIDITVSKEQGRSFLLHVPAEANSVDVILDCVTGDALLVASCLVQNPGVVDNTWFDFSAPSHKQKRLRISHDQLLPQGSNAVHVSVVGFTTLCQAKISIDLDGAQNDDVKVETKSLSLPNEDDLRLCANCGSSVPAARFDMHRIVCERHNVKCTRCDSIFKRGSDEAKRHWHCELCNVSGDIDDSDKHLHFFHTPVSCTCDTERSAFASIVELAEHRRTRCPERLIECRYCHNIEPQGPASEDATDIMDGLNAHEAYCGNRTIECTKCKANVRIRQVLVHMRMHQMREQVARENMVPCANKECSRERASNPLGLCTSCFGPFYTGQHDPDNHKLLKRLARALHTQMTRGCGSQRCRNLMCATGLQNIGSSSDSAVSSLSQTEAAALMVPILKAYTPLSTLPRPSIDYAKIDLHLCK